MNTSNKYSGRKLKKPDMKQAGNFTQIPNAFILNPNIRDPELRLLQYILMFSDHRTITTKNCILYLGKTKPAIIKSFEKLIALGILKIDNENIEIIIPEEMKKYKLGYLDGKETNTNEVNKTLPSESKKTLQEGKENLTIEVKNTLLPGKENITTEVKKTFNKPLEYIDNVSVTNPVILNNSRVLPAPATSGSAEQSHSMDNTKGKTAIESGLLECDTLTSARIPSGVPQTLHTPTGVRESKSTSSDLINNTPTEELECNDITMKSTTNVLVNNSIPKIDAEKVIPKVSDYIYNGIEVQKEIRQYQSTFFTIDNYEYITNGYNEYRKTSDIKIMHFDALMFLYLHNLWVTENNTNNLGIKKTTATDGHALNEYIKNNQYSVNVLDLQGIWKRISIDKKFFNECAELMNNPKFNVRIKPSQIPAVPPEKDNYDDLPI